MYGAKQLVIASQETSNYRVFVGELRRAEDHHSFRWLDPSAGDRDTYLYESPAATCYARRSRSQGTKFSLLALDHASGRVRDLNPEFLGPLANRYDLSLIHI